MSRKHFLSVLIAAPLLAGSANAAAVSLPVAQHLKSAKEQTTNAQTTLWSSPTLQGLAPMSDAEMNEVTGEVAPVLVLAAKATTAFVTGAVGAGVTTYAGLKLADAVSNWLRN